MSDTSRVLNLGSIGREDAAEVFPFLAKRFKGRRKALRAFTHQDPDYVFWVDPEGRLIDARDGHLNNPPKGFEHILHDHPHYGGYLRGRVASDFDEHQLIVVYCAPEAMDIRGTALKQFASGMAQLPIPINDTALVVGDNADIYGTLRDCIERAEL